MVAFAVGGLLGDTIFHLLPEIFLGEALPENARFVLVEPNKNILLGVAILVGFVTFVAMDKGLRIATGGEGDHNHSHNDDHKVEATASEKEEEDDVSTSGTTTGADSSLIYDNLLSRKTKPTAKATEVPLDPPSNLEKILALDEPDRTNEWLQAVLEASPSSALTQMTLWRAYESQLEASTSSTLLAPPAFIKKITTLFPTAKAVTVNVRTPQGSESEYLVDGIGPRSRSPAISPRPSPSASASPSIRLSAYLNLLADFTHNITDGLALSASFYASPTLGATTTVAVFFHEIPHEVGDFALLIQSGFSKRRAMAAQFVTALGAFLGTFLGIAVQELGKTTAAAKGVHGDAGGTVGFFGTGLGWGDLLLPFTAGTFLYVGTVAVIPDLLETGPDRGLELTKTIKQFAALTVGAGIMLA